MSEKTELQMLGDETRPFFEKFWEVIAPYQNELWKYCKKIAGNPWDGEDLFQDTILKMFTSLSSLSHRGQPIHPRAFLFRVATNHWIDICRKRKVLFEEWSENLNATPISEPSLDIQGAFETLLQYLPVRQTVVLVLVDAFQFTTREVAEVLGTTEGAIHSVLFRARGNLRKLAEKGTEETKVNLNLKPDPALVERYVSFFNSGDFQGIAGLLADHAVYSFVTQSSKEYGKNTIMNESHNPARNRRNDLRAEIKELWGKQSVVFFKVSEKGIPIALNEVMTIETDEGYIVGLSGYYFCPQFMDAAALELGTLREG